MPWSKAKQEKREYRVRGRGLLLEVAAKDLPKLVQSAMPRSVHLILKERRYSKSGKQGSPMTRSVLSKELRWEEGVRRGSSKSPEA